jgi:hypothetical protein
LVRTGALRVHGGLIGGPARASGGWSARIATAKHAAAGLAAADDLLPRPLRPCPAARRTRPCGAPAPACSRLAGAGEDPAAGPLAVPGSVPPVGQLGPPGLDTFPSLGRPPGKGLADLGTPASRGDGTPSHQAPRSGGAAARPVIDDPAGGQRGLGGVTSATYHACRKSRAASSPRASSSPARPSAAARRST